MSLTCWNSRYATAVGQRPSAARASFAIFLTCEPVSVVARPSSSSAVAGSSAQPSGSARTGVCRTSARAMSFRHFAEAYFHFMSAYAQANSYQLVTAFLWKLEVRRLLAWEMCRFGGYRSRCN